MVCHIKHEACGCLRILSYCYKDPIKILQCQRSLLQFHITVVNKIKHIAISLLRHHMKTAAEIDCVPGSIPSVFGESAGANIVT